MNKKIEKNIFYGSKKQYCYDNITQAFNLINKKYNLSNIKIKMYDHSYVVGIKKKEKGPYSIKYEFIDNKNEITVDSENLSLGVYIVLDNNIKLLLEKYFSGFKINVSYCRDDAQILFSLSW